MQWRHRQIKTEGLNGEETEVSDRLVHRDVSKETLLKFQQEISLKFPEISNGIFLEISRKFQKLVENHEISDILEISEISRKFQGII